MVNGDRIFDGLRLGHGSLAFRHVECRLDQSGNTAETKAPADKLAHGDFVCRVEDRGRRAAGGKRPARQRQGRKARQIWLFEGQRGNAREVEALVPN